MLDGRLSSRLFVAQRAPSCALERRDAAAPHRVAAVRAMPGVKFSLQPDGGAAGVPKTPAPPPADDACRRGAEGVPKTPAPPPVDGAADGAGRVCWGESCPLTRRLLLPAQRAAETKPRIHSARLPELPPAARRHRRAATARAASDFSEDHQLGFDLTKQAELSLPERLSNYLSNRRELETLQREEWLRPKVHIADALRKKARNAGVVALKAETASRAQTERRNVRRALLTDPGSRTERQGKTLVSVLSRFASR